MTGGLAWQDGCGLCTSCQQRPPYWGAVCQPCGVALGVGSWADGPNQPQPVGVVHMPPGATREQMAEVASWLPYLARKYGTQGGNTTFHPGGVIRAPGGGTGTNTASQVRLIKLPPRRQPAKARPRRSLARLAGSVGDSASWGLLATWVGWLVIPGIGYVHAVHLSLIILAAAATILTVAGLCGYGRNSRED